MENKKLTIETVKGFMDESYSLAWVDYRESLENCFNVVQKCINDKSGYDLDDYINDLYIDSRYEESERVMEELKDKCIENGYPEEEMETFFEENEDLIRDEIYGRDDSDVVKDLCKNTSDIPVRIELHSTYDCINSHWLESRGGYSYEETYFGDMVDALKLNPAKVKKLLIERGEKVYGRFPNKKYRDGKELVSYSDFYQELENTSCGANLLVFTAKINALELYKADFKLDKIMIPKGNYCGIYSSCYGGGSVLEMELKYDVKIKLNAKKYDYFSLELDCRGASSGYCIKEVYGVLDSFYGDSIKLTA